MNRFIIYAIGVLVLLSCSKKNEAINLLPLKTDKVSLLLNNDIAHVDSFTIEYSQAWSLTITPSGSTWLKTNITSYTGNSKVYVTVLESNNSGVIREATINVFPDGKPGQAVSIQVKQSVKQWQQIAPFPGVGRKMASSFVIADKFYVGLGRGMKDNSEQTLSDFYVFNATSNTWKQLSNFPGGAREFALGFSINGKGYIAAGRTVDCPTIPGLCTETEQKDFWEYDASTDKWKQVGNFDVLNKNGSSGTVFTINDKAYIVDNEKLWEFDPLNYSLNQKSACPQPFIYSVAFTLNNKGYLGTGRFDGKGFFEYDPAVDKWSKKADFAGSARRSAIGFSVNGKGYIGGGMGIMQLTPNSTQEVGLNDIWEYNSLADTWVRVEDFPNIKPRYSVAGVLNGKALVGTGEDYPNPFSHKEFLIY